MLPVLAIVTIGTFSLVQFLPGGPVKAHLGEDGVTNPELVARMEEELGLDRPVAIQYLDWVWGLMQGDFGTSLRTQEGVLEALRTRAVPTVTLAVAALSLSILIGIPLGVLAAVHRGSPLDAFATTVGVAGVAMPNFWLGILLIVLFSINLGLLPTSGYVAITENPLEAIKHLLMPAFALGTSGAAVLMRQTRSSMLEVLSSDFVRTARAKGLGSGTVLFGHALRASLLPVVTVIGLQVGNLLGGSVVVEQVFAIPGIGRFAVGSIAGRDFLVIQGIVVLTSITVLGVNLATDIAYALLDPRIRVR
jgi:peptide/nickel transport system permease protein